MRDETTNKDKQDEQPTEEQQEAAGKLKANPNPRANANLPENMDRSTDTSEITDGEAG